MQTGECDELPAVAELGEALDICFLLVAGHGCFPVERGGEVVCESVIFVISFATKKRDWMIGGGGGFLTFALARRRGHRRQTPLLVRNREVSTPSISCRSRVRRQRRG